MVNIMDYMIRCLLGLMGVGNITLATLDNSNDILLKVLLFMSGIITLLLSVFFTGFMVHLTNHSKDRRILFEEINNRLDEIKKAVCPQKKE
jgi:hypothetical protein